MMASNFDGVSIWFFFPLRHLAFDACFFTWAHQVPRSFELLEPFFSLGALAVSEAQSRRAPVSLFHTCENEDLTLKVHRGSLHCPEIFTKKFEHLFLYGCVHLILLPHSWSKVGVCFDFSVTQLFIYPETNRSDFHAYPGSLDNLKFTPSIKILTALFSRSFVFEFTFH